MYVGIYTREARAHATGAAATPGARLWAPAGVVAHASLSHQSQLYCFLVGRDRKARHGPPVASQHGDGEPSCPGTLPVQDIGQGEAGAGRVCVPRRPLFGQSKKLNSSPFFVCLVALSRKGGAVSQTEPSPTFHCPHSFHSAWGRPISLRPQPQPPQPGRGPQLFQPGDVREKSEK